MLYPQIKDQLYYSFDVKGYHFVALYAMENLCADPRWGNIFRARVSDLQFDWLMKDLKSMKRNSKGVVLFLHQPLWYNWGDWQRVHDLLIKYKTVAVIAGHFHYNQIENYSFFPYITVGATGGDIKQTNPAQGGLQHVTIIDVKGQRISRAKIIPLNSDSMFVFQPRRVMDRIQALDVSSDNVYFQPIYSKKGKLVNNCNKEEPASLRMMCTTNPFDFTSLLHLNIDTKGIQPVNPSFKKNMCSSTSQDKMSCHMVPGANIWYVNNSLVGGDCSEPFWVATIQQNQPHDSKDPIIVSTIVNADSYSIKRSYKVPVYDCGSDE